MLNLDFGGMSCLWRVVRDASSGAPRDVTLDALQLFSIGIAFG